jgi:hypothetical protein
MPKWHRKGNIPRAALFMRCARGVSEVLGLLLIMIPVKPMIMERMRYCFLLAGRWNQENISASVTYHGKQESMPVKLQLAQHPQSRGLFRREAGSRMWLSPLSMAAHSIACRFSCSKWALLSFD